MNAIVVSVGDELVLGQTVDTNSAWISAQLAAVGCDIAGHETVSDSQAAIERALRDASRRCDCLIISGGIGPTADDLTRHALAAVLGVELVLDERWLTKLSEFFKARQRPMPKSNRIQAMIPRGVNIIENTCGTAAGMHTVIELREPAHQCNVFVVPGVPSEMKAMLTRDVLPWIKARTRGAVILQRTLHTFGMGESWVAEQLGDLMRRDRNPSVGTTVANGIVSLRINARFETLERAEHELDQTTNACRQSLGAILFGQDEQTLQESLKALLQDGATVTTAESCTGGLVAKMITDVPGSSAYFKTGFITYSNKSKYERLGVSEAILNTYGAVSEPVVRAMATGALKLAKSNYALAISGIAGPDGGTTQKPVGTVCIALAYILPEIDGGPARDRQVQTLTRTFHFPGDRDWVRERAARMALTMLRFHLLGQPLPF